MDRYEQQCFDHDMLGIDPDRPHRVGTGGSLSTYLSDIGTQPPASCGHEPRCRTRDEHGAALNRLFDEIAAENRASAAKRRAWRTE